MLTLLLVFIFNLYFISSNNETTDNDEYAKLDEDIELGLSLKQKLHHGIKNRISTRSVRKYLLQHFNWLKPEQERRSPEQHTDNTITSDGSSNSSLEKSTTSNFSSSTTEQTSNESFLPLEIVLEEKTTTNNTGKPLDTGSWGEKFINIWRCLMGTEKQPTEDQVLFLLFTRKTKNTPERIQINIPFIQYSNVPNMKKREVKCVDFDTEEKLEFKPINNDNLVFVNSSKLNVNAPTKIIIHGYTGSCRDTRMKNIRDAYLESSSNNVIMVNWEELAAPPCYITVTRYTRYGDGTRFQNLVNQQLKMSLYK